MDLGAFSVSLAVSDLAASRAFYETLGFTVTGGDDENWSIMVNGPTVIGLFQGMFDRNVLTFNPGWDAPGSESSSFTDVRELKARLVEAGLELNEDSAAEDTEGPAYITLTDPDGNPILIDQHR